MTNWELLFRDCYRVAKTHHLYGNKLSQCVRFVYVGCKGCIFEGLDCDSLNRYDASVEWLQEESE